MSRDELSQLLGRRKPEEIRTYEEEYSFLEGLRQMGFNLDDTSDRIKHELDHFYEAVRRGYDGFFTIRIWRDAGKRVAYQLAVEVPGHVDSEDAVAMIRAPRDLSLGDLEELDKFESVTGVGRE